MVNIVSTRNKGYLARPKRQFQISSTKVRTNAPNEIKPSAIDSKKSGNWFHSNFQTLNGKIQVFVKPSGV
jgi:hypothetical protein